MNRSQEDQGSHMRPLVRVAVVLLLLLLVVAGVQSWRDLTEARALQSTLEADIATTEESIHVLSDRLKRIESDPSTLEQLAREELGWVSEDDIVIVMPREDEAVEASGREDETSGEPVSLP